MAKSAVPAGILFLTGVAEATDRSTADDRTAHARSEVLRLFDETAPGLRRYIRSFGLDPATTEDVAQDVFLALFRHLCLGRPGGHLTGWLFTVAHNLALKKRSRLARRARTEVALDPGACPAADQTASPEAQLALTRDATRLRAAFQDLQARDRQCLQLRAEGLRYRAIASTLGISLGSVAKSVARGLARLDATLNEGAHDRS
jgi:RNA polymerase sigma-70 factor (ECF subfamily)